jgi:predicted NAD/FAD-dependent oxidoreductase
MNERPGAASARVFVRSLREAFLSDRASSSLAVPRAGLSALLVDPAISYIAARGGEVRLGVDVCGTVEKGGSVTGVRTRAGDVFDASSVVLAVPSGGVMGLLPASYADRFRLERISAAAVSPILCVHLWYNRNVSPHEVLGVLGRRVQWVFRHGRPEEERLSLVISAAHEESTWTNEQLIAAGVEDCTAIFGENARHPRHAVVIREKRATFSLTPEVEALRPGTRTSIPNMFLAGDWTATGLPATVEGAIRSGEAAAECIASGPGAPVRRPYN